VKFINFELMKMKVRISGHGHPEHEPDERLVGVVLVDLTFGNELDLTASGADLTAARTLAARVAANAPLALAAVKAVIRAAQGGRRRRLPPSGRTHRRRDEQRTTP
jgi:hypothetical protein